MTPKEPKDYEMTLPDDDFGLEVARKVEVALDRLEAAPPAEQKVLNR